MTVTDVDEVTPNGDPVPQPDIFTTDENTAIGAGLSLFADNGAGVDSDPDGDPLTVLAVNGAEAAVGTQITLASGAYLTVNSDGTFAFDPNGAFDALNTGESDTDSFTYTVSDGRGGEASETVTIVIDGVTDWNVIDMDPFQAKETGTDGNDVILIDASRSSQVLGGAGADVFVFGEAVDNGRRDVAYLRDFQQGEDLIDLSGFGYNILTVGTSSIIVLDTPDRDTLFVTGAAPLTNADFTDAWSNGSLL